MSKNLSTMAGRFGLEKNLFEDYVVSADKGELDKEKLFQLSDQYLVGEAASYGTASAYDFLKEDLQKYKAYVCNGTACKLAGKQSAVKQSLSSNFAENEIGEMCCLGRCYETSAFQVNGKNFSGEDISHPENWKTENGTLKNSYVIENEVSPLGPKILTGEPLGIVDVQGRLEKLLAMTAEEALDQIKKSGLRGRGGAGFPAGLKWESCKTQTSSTKYIVCNADEGDPGAFSDRYLMEEQPLLLLLGMMISGYIAGASWGVLYVRAEYPESVTVLREKIEELKRAGLLGKNILGKNFEFNFKLVKGAGAYICGEETALLSSLEGLRPEVRVRPPFPTVSGLFGKPTIINNVETFACAPFIIENGGEAYANVGTAKSTGTKLLCLDSHFVNSGLVEVPMGTSLSQAIHSIGGGFKTDIKALQIGGPLGGVLPINAIEDLTVDFESFQKAGFLLGHGSIVSIPGNESMMEYIKHLLEFTAHESCGKCFPCRLGSQRGAEMVSKSLEGNGYKIDSNLMSDLLETLKETSLCGLGGGVPLPIQNILEHFSGELEPYFKKGDV